MEFKIVVRILYVFKNCFACITKCSMYIFKKKLGISKILFIFSIIAQVSKVCSNFKMCSHFLEKNVHGFKNVFASVNFCAEFSIYFIELFVKT